MPSSPGDRLYIRVTAGNVNGPMTTKHTDVLADNTTINCLRESVIRPGGATQVNNLGYIVFPNPANSQLMLGYPPSLRESGPVTIRVYSMQGGFVHEQQFTPSLAGGVEMVNIERLSPGVYTLVSQTDQDVFRNSFVVLK